MRPRIGRKEELTGENTRFDHEAGVGAGLNAEVARRGVRAEAGGKCVTGRAPAGALWPELGGANFGTLCVIAARANGHAS